MYVQTEFTNKLCQEIYNMKHQEYFYVSPDLISADAVVIKGEEFKHLSIVHRKKAREIVQVVDGRGNLYTVLLEHIGRQEARGSIQKRQRFAGEPNFNLTLAQAIPKGSRFELVIEKGTEIGVSTFIPLLTERTVVNAGETKLKRWNKIAVAAMKQSARSLLPEIHAPINFAEFMTDCPVYDFQLIGHAAGGMKSLTEVIESEKRKHRDLNRIKKGIILIGPEGGFIDEEVQKALDLNFLPFSLGPRRLRSETAGIVAAAILMELVENCDKYLKK